VDGTTSVDVLVDLKFKELLVPKVMHSLTSEWLPYSWPKET